MGNTERVVGDFELSLSPKNEREIASSCSSNKPNNTYNWMHPRAVDRMHASSQLATSIKHRQRPTLARSLGCFLCVVSVVSEF